MNKNEIKNILKSKGLAHIYEWSDQPNKVYETHSHKGRVTFYVVKGSITMKIKDQTIILNANDNFDVPVGINHSAIVGPDGCTFVVGEEIEGDS